MPQLETVHLSKVRLIIHSWRLPNFRTDLLRHETRRALQYSLHKVYPDLVRADIEFTENPIKAIDMEGVCVGARDEDEQQAYLVLIRPQVNALVEHVLRRYVEADGAETARKGKLRDVRQEERDHWADVETARFGGHRG